MIALVPGPLSHQHLISLAALDGHLLAQRPPGAAALGWRCFQLGLLLLASSAFLGSLLLFVALLQGSLRRRAPLADLADRVLLLIAALMVVGCFFASSGWLAWVGMGNWLPFFWAFWGFQPYLATTAARRRVALMLVAGTVPVIVTGLGQLWGGWSGPFQALGGLIIWHLGAGGNPPGRGVSRQSGCGILAGKRFQPGSAAKDFHRCVADRRRASSNRCMG